MRLSGPTLLALAGAAIAVGCGDDPERDPVAEVTVCETLDEDAPDGQLRVEGEAMRVPGVRSGLVLADGDCYVFVESSRREAVEAEQGDTLIVTGLMDRLSALQAERIEFGLGRGDGPPATLRADTEEGDPYVNSFAVNEALGEEGPN
jgi:hypothetical protein